MAYWLCSRARAALKRDRKSERERENSMLLFLKLIYSNCHRYHLHCNWVFVVVCWIFSCVSCAKTMCITTNERERRCFAHHHLPILPICNTHTQSPSFVVAVPSVQFPLVTVWATSFLGAVHSYQFDTMSRLLLDNQTLGFGLIVYANATTQACRFVQ